MKKKSKRKNKKPEYLELTKAYHDIEFMNSPPARPIRVLSEILEPAYRLRKNKIHNTVVFFGSARTLPRSKAKKDLAAAKRKIHKTKSLSAKLKEDLDIAQNELLMSQYYEDAALLAKKLTHWFNAKQNKKRGFIVCSGGGPGIMEAASLGAKKAKGRSVGFNISLPMEQFANIYQTPEISFEFHYFFIRKFWFFYLAKALAIFPGGFGTLDELFEILTLIQTEKTKKYMPVVLYGKKYWDELLNFDAMVKWRTISKSDLKLFRIYDDVDEAFHFLKKELNKHYFRNP